MEDLVPLNGCLLVELTETLKIVATPDKPYSSHTSGIVRGVWDEPDNKVAESLIGKEVFFEEYRDSTQVERGGKKLAFIKWEDIRGYEDN